jgi:HPt (histidine-containing phosphotransfer) domain-containing protein
MRPFRREFASKVRLRLDEIADLLDRIETVGEGDEKAREALHRHFHFLAGAGGSYGFPSVSSLGGEGEETLQGEPRRELRIARLRELVARLRIEVSSDDSAAP